jgi:hypothetical protein
MIGSSGNPLLLSHWCVGDNVVAGNLVEMLDITPFARAPVLQPEYRCGRVWRLRVLADCELVETALNPVIGRLFSGL